jgi:Protein kinase domain
MNLHATQLHESELAGGSPPLSPASAPSNRFTYASGSRPLQGYTIKRGIGHGGFGEVYYATSDAGKEVALKLIRRNLDVELRGVTQCLNLKHPNLLSLYDVRQDDQGDTWVVMELMADHSLEEVLNQHPDGLPRAEALAWIHGIAAGVAYLHDHGIVHRDLKPGNIFVDEGIVKIGDYGLSKFISCSRRSGQTGSVGTVHYMAPEVANGRYGKEIDIYALGIILYEMLTGHVPFEGESIGEILMKHLTAEPDVGRLDEPYRTIVARALAKDPAKRFNSVGELIDLLPPAPTAAALTAAARFAGPNPAVASPSAAAAGNAAPFIGGAAMPNPAATQQWTPGNAAAGPAGGTKPTNEDPVVKWIRETRNEATSWWTRKNFRPWQKVLIFAVGIWVAMGVFAEIDASSHRQLNVGHLIIFAAIGYGLYRMVQARSGSSSRASSSPFPASQPVVQMPPVNRPAPPVAQAQPLPQRDPLRESPTRRRWRYQTPVYNPGTPRERLTQLLGSMLLSAAVCAVAALVMMILRGEMPDSNQYAWLALSSTIGSWAILIPAKFWEGKRGDAALRRFVMLVVGLGFGLIVSALMSWLFVSLPYSHEFSRSVNSDFAHSFYAADGTPKPIAFLAYFGFLFVIPRWWRQADPMRSTRLSIWHTAVALFWAAVLSTFWPFPQPWGWMIAATIAISVQLASPWFSPAERSQMKSQAVGA